MEVKQHRIAHSTAAGFNTRGRCTSSEAQVIASAVHPAHVSIFACGSKKKEDRGKSDPRMWTEGFPSLL